MATCTPLTPSKLALGIPNIHTLKYWTFIGQCPCLCEVMLVSVLISIPISPLKWTDPSVRRDQSWLGWSRSSPDPPQCNHGLVLDYCLCRMVSVMVWHHQTGESYPMNSAGGTVAMGQALTVRSELYPCFLHTRFKPKH